MPNDNDLLTFLEKREVRVARLSASAKRMMKTQRFDQGVAELESKFPGSKAHIYGTRVMKLGHVKSHLNIFLDIDNSYWETQRPEKVDEMMKQLKEYFGSQIVSGDLSADSLWEGPIRTLKTPVPTLRIYHKKLQTDITFSNGLGVENTKLVNHMFSLQPEAFELYHFVRIWIHIDEFAFKRYMVALLVLFYLQNKRLMPSVLQLQDDVDEKFIAGYNVAFNCKKKLSDYGMEIIENYTDHLVGFFEFYGSFDFSNNVICPYLGRAVPLSAYPGTDEELKKYKDNIKSFNKAAVNVTDLTNLNFNCAHGVGRKRLTRFNHFCPHAVELLQNTL